MSFERYAGEGRTSTRNKPMASIRANGKIGLNRMAVEAYGVKEFSHAVLFFDKEQHMVGLMFTQDAFEEGAVALCWNKEGKDCYISAGGFLTKFKILHKKAGSYELTLHAEIPGMMAFSPKRGRGRPRTR